MIKLCRVLYGLKKATPAWYRRIRATLEKTGLMEMKLAICGFKNEHVIAMSHEDDLLVMRKMKSDLKT